MSRPRTKDFVYFSGYLSQQHPFQHHGPEQMLAIGGCMALIISSIALTAAGFMLASFLGAFGGFILAFPVTALIWSFVAKKVKRPLTEEQLTQQKVWEAVKSFKGLKEQKKLHKWVDPVILQVLEAGAYHWARVKTVSASQKWRSMTLPGHWTSIRDQADDSADKAMAELVLMASHCIGEPEKDRKKDFENVVEDFFDLEIADSLAQLKRVTTSSWKDYAYQSPIARQIFEPARDIAERLKLLADELEKMDAEMPIEMKVGAGPVSTRATSADSIDLLLGEMKAVREAENELGDQENLYS